MRGSMAKTILLAEDDPAHVEFFRRAIDAMDLDCQLVVLADGASVIDYLFAMGTYAHRRSDEPPDLIFLDLRLPGLSGLQVLQMLRRSRGDDRIQLVPIIVLTCSDEQRDIAESYRYGAQSYIHKPANYRQFIDGVRETIHYWLEVNEPAPRLRHTTRSRNESSE